MENWTIFIDYNYRFIADRNEQVGLPALIFGMDGATRYESRSELNVPVNGSYYREMLQSAYSTINIYSSYDYVLNDNHNFKLMLGGQEESYKYADLWSKAADRSQSGQKSGTNAIL